jgi:prevent-host-death family protein
LVDRGDERLSLSSVRSGRHFWGEHRATINPGSGVTAEAVNLPANLTVDLEVHMERFVGVEDARSSLGRLVEEVAAGGDVVALTKRGKALAVLVSRDEYAQMKLAASERARAELNDALGGVREAVRQAGLGVEVIDEAIAAARQL